MKKFLSSTLLKLCGWQVHGVAPEHDQCVIIAVPHTSNWDFVWMKLMAWSLDWQVNWLGKHTLFTGLAGLAGPIMRAWGGVPVDRRSKQDLVSQVIARFKAGEKLALAIPAEGTRDRSENWRSGFYHIAKGARVPIVLSFLDYGTRTGGIGPALETTNDLAGDMKRIRAFYAGMQGKYPELSGPSYLREENHQPSASDPSDSDPR